MHRLFVALRPPPAMRDRLLALCDGVDGARWQDDAQLHLTLRYIGEVERPVAEDIAVALQRVRAAPIDLALAGVGAFEGGGRQRSLWVGVTPHAAVAALHRKIDHALVGIGLPPERRAFMPHITLARLNRSSGPIAPFVMLHGGLTSPIERLAHFTLYESDLTPDGPDYSPIARYPLDRE